MKDEMNKNDMIIELDRIAALYDKFDSSFRKSMDDLTDEKEKEDQNLEERIGNKLYDFQIEQEKNFEAKKPAIAAACLISPPKPPDKPDTKNPMKDILIGSLSGLLSIISAVLWVVCVFANLGNKWFGFGIILILTMLSSIAVWFMAGTGKIETFLEWQGKRKEWKEKQEEWEKKFNEVATKEENERFINEFKNYDACFLKFVDVCSKKYSDENKRYVAELEKISKKYVDNLNKLHDEWLGVKAQLDSVTLIHCDLFKIASRISFALKTGRAETLKEAINLAIDDERKDVEEATRRAEAQQREEILEQQAIDNRAHNEKMQRVAEENAIAMRRHNAEIERTAQEQARAAQAQAAEAARQSELAQRQAKEAQRAAISRCSYCVNNMKCTFQAKQNAASCAAYRPR